MGSKSRMFRLSKTEAEEVWRSRSQFVTLNKPENRSQAVTGPQKHPDPRHLPCAFTEHGAIMARKGEPVPHPEGLSAHTLWRMQAFQKAHSNALLILSQAVTESLALNRSQEIEAELAGGKRV